MKAPPPSAPPRLKKRKKIANHVGICGRDGGDAPRCILTSSALSSNSCLAPKNHRPRLCRSIRIKRNKIHNWIFVSIIIVSVAFGNNVLTPD